jgi:hypothetical protein
MATRESLGSAVFLAGGIWLVNASCLAADCAQGDALTCYTQALVRVQTAEDALGAARKDIGELQASVNTLKARADEASAQIADLKMQIAELKARTVEVGSPTVAKTFNPGDFWTPAQDTPVNFTCPGKDVLGGMNFVMHSDGVGRHPFKIDYICKSLGPLGP